MAGAERPRHDEGRMTAGLTRHPRETTDRFCVFVTWTLTLISRTYMTSRALTDTSKIPISRINLFEAAEFRVPPCRDVRIVARLFYAVP